MPDWKYVAPSLCHEVHFGNQVIPCFSERPQNFYEMFGAAVRWNPDGEAIICGDDRLTWQSLETLANRLAAGFTRLDIKHGDRIALLLGNRTEFVATVIAAARLGVIVAPLNIREQNPAISELLARIDPKLIIHEADLAHLVATDSYRCVSVGTSQRKDSFESLLEQDAAHESTHVSEDDTLFIIPTSGTTGQPKLPMLSHLGVIHSAINMVACLKLTPADRTIVAVPLSHTAGLISALATFVCAAGTQILLKEFKANSFLVSAAAERMTHAVMVPAMYDLCLRTQEFDQLDLSAWRLGVFGGAPMPPVTIARLAERLPSLSLFNAYGSTELGGVATLSHPEDSADHPDTVGHAFESFDLIVMDDENREVPPDTPGELWGRGPTLSSGYWKDPGARDFVGGFFRTGDIVSISPTGLVRLVDRKKDILNRGGFKIPSVEVESVLYEHPAIVECAIVGKPCEVLGERVHAFLRLLQGTQLDEAEIKSFCSSQLADFKVPESFTFLDEAFPRNAAGKILKSELRERLLGLLPKPSDSI